MLGEIAKSVLVTLAACGSLTLLIVCYNKHNEETRNRAIEYQKNLAVKAETYDCYINGERIDGTKCNLSVFGDGEIRIDDERKEIIVTYKTNNDTSNNSDDFYMNYYLFNQITGGN